MARSLGGRNTKINIRHLKQPTLVKHALNIWCVSKKILADCYIFVFHDKVTKIRVYLTRRPRSHCGGCWQTLCHYKVAGWEWWWQWWWPSLTIIIIKVAGHRVGSSKKFSTLRSHRQSENSLFVILRSLLNRSCALIGTKAKVTLKHISERDGPVLESAPVWGADARADLTEIFIGFIRCDHRLNS